METRKKGKDELERKNKNKWEKEEVAAADLKEKCRI